MPRKYAKSTKKFSRTKRTYKRSIARVNRRISAVSKRVAGEVCKFESTPSLFSNSHVVVGTSSEIQRPLQTITSGVPYIYPLNWFYTPVTSALV